MIPRVSAVRCSRYKSEYGRGDVFQIIRRRGEDRSARGAVIRSRPRECLSTLLEDDSTKLTALALIVWFIHFTYYIKAIRFRMSDVRKSPHISPRRLDKSCFTSHMPGTDVLKDIIRM